MTTRTDAERRVRRTHLSTTWGVTAVSALVMVTVMLLWSGDLPGELATHFDGSGTPDDTLPTGVALGLFVLTGIGLPALLIVVFAATEWWRGEQARLSAGFLAGLPAGLATLFLVLLEANRGATGPEDVQLSPWLALVGLGVALVVGLLVALAVPRGLPRQDGQDVPEVPVARGERASWFGRARSARWMVLVLLAGSAVLVIAAVASGIWWMWLTVVLVALLGLGVTSFTVRVDASGVTWRGALGYPRGHIPMGQITGASVIDASPAAFGGFGLRMTPGALGLITRRGSALEVTHGTRRFVATVDDAPTAAGLVRGHLQSRALR